MSAARIEFFFDCSSPWTYLAFERIQPIAAQTGAQIAWKPILVGGVFNTVNDSVYAQRASPNPVKARYYAKDLKEWAKHVGVRIGSPPVFPVRSVTAMRGAFFALDQGDRALVAFSRALFEAYWGDLKDISQPDEIAACARSAGLDPDAVLAYASSEDAKARLKSNTDELIARGGFGSPTIFIDRAAMYFGNDRMELVAAALARPPAA
jgi:2-hydroxychromene-2-carboxylate isomerase